MAPLIAGEVKLRVREQPNAIERFEMLWRFAHEAWVKQGWATTANLLIHASAFEAIGGFDASYRHYGEDVDFCMRASGAHYDLGYCASAVVEHAGEQRLAPFVRRFFMHGYGGNQTFYRLGEGARTWRDPIPVLSGGRALTRLGFSPDQLKPSERRRMLGLAQLGYAARIAGSVWAELVRAR
jgi:GT2 family glycosyltransferase